MRTTNLLCLLMMLCSKQLASASDGDADAEQIKKLIPAATAMSRTDFNTMATDTQPNEAKFEDKSLTLMLYTLQVVGGEDEQAKEEFQFLGDGPPKPSELAKETLRSRFGAATLIHAERITDLTCEVDGDKALGAVSFQVPNLYQGKVEYAATKSEGKWKIVEFSMPAREIHIIRDENDKWKKK